MSSCNSRLRISVWKAKFEICKWIKPYNCVACRAEQKVEGKERKDAQLLFPSREVAGFHQKTPVTVSYCRCSVLSIIALPLQTSITALQQILHMD